MQDNIHDLAEVRGCRFESTSRTHQQIALAPIAIGLDLQDSLDVGVGFDEGRRTVRPCFFVLNFCNDEKKKQLSSVRLVLVAGVALVLSGPVMAFAVGALFPLLD